MNELWFSSAGWFTHTAFAGGLVLAFGWILARKAAPTSARSVAGWAVRGAVLTAALCLMPGWITLPTPNWVNPPSPATPQAKPKETTLPDSSWTNANDLVAKDVSRGDDGEWVLLDVTADREATGATPASWVAPEKATAVVEFTNFHATPPVAESSSVKELALDISRVILVAYGFGLAFAVGQLLLAQVALARIVAAASTAPGRVRDLFAESCEKTGVKARLLLSNRVSSPVCFGLFSPTVVLPKHLAQTAYDDELKWVFAHELDHLRRGDQRLAWWVGIARALYFFMPSFWAVRKHLGLAQEYLADAAAAKSGNAADYAQFLVTLSSAPIDRRVSRHPLTATGVRAGRSDLFRRVNMLVNAAPETKSSRRWTTLAAGGTLGAAILLSGFGFAADDNKSKSKEDKANAAEVVTEKVPVKDDDQAEKRAAEAKARADDARARAKAAQADAERAMRDAEKAQAEAVKAARETRADAVRTITTVRAGESKAVDALKKEIAEAAKKGDLEAVNKAVEKLAKIATATPRAVTMLGGVDNVRPNVFTAPTVPAVPMTARTAPMAPVPPAPPMTRFIPAQAADAMKTAHEQAMKQMKAALDRVKDNPEAKAELEKAMKEFQKAMEKAKKEMPQAFNQWQGQLQGFDGQNFEWKVAPQFQGFDMAPTRANGEGRFGVMIEAIPADVAKEHDIVKGIGVKVIEVVPDSAAAKAGIKSGDLILELAGKPVPGEPQDVVRMIGKVKKDEKVNVIVLRDGKKKTIEGVAIPEGKAVRGRVLEVNPDGHFEHFDIAPLVVDEKKIQEKIARVQKEIDEVHKKAAKAGGKIEGKNVSISVSVNDGEYTIDADKDGVKYTIKGTTEDGTESIVIKDGDKTIKAKSVDKLPEAYRADVKKMLGQVKISK